jgi:hypothetical protein
MATRGALAAERVAMPTVAAVTARMAIASREGMPRRM